MTEYRRARADELPDVIDFINLVFSMAHEPHDFKALLPKAYGDCACFTPEHYIALEDGRIRGAVGLLENEMTVLGEKIKIGVVGSVSAHAYSHGRGHMKACMQMMLADAQKKGLQLLYLGGRRQRYEYFGFSQGGISVHFNVRADNFRHGLASVQTNGYSFTELAPYAAEAEQLYSAQIVHAGRSAEDFRLIAESWNAKPFAICKYGKFVGYLITDGLNISEMVLADENDFVGVFKAWHVQKDNAHVQISVPVWNVRRIRTLAKIAGSISSGPSDMFRIEDFETNIRLWLKLKATYTRLMDGKFVLESEGNKLAIAVQSNQVSVEKSTDAPDAVLDRLAAQDLLLATHRWVDTDAMPACVENWFPLPISCFRADGF